MVRGRESEGHRRVLIRRGFAMVSVMKIGAVYPQIELGGDPEAVRRIATAAESLGYDYLLAFDHVLGASPDREPKLTGP